MKTGYNVSTSLFLMNNLITSISFGGAARQLSYHEKVVHLARTCGMTPFKNQFSVETMALARRLGENKV